MQDKFNPRQKRQRIARKIYWNRLALFVLALLMIASSVTVLVFSKKQKPEYFTAAADTVYVSGFGGHLSSDEAEKEVSLLLSRGIPAGAIKNKSGYIVSTGIFTSENEAVRRNAEYGQSGRYTVFTLSGKSEKFLSVSARHNTAVVYLFGYVSTFLSRLSELTFELDNAKISAALYEKSVLFLIDELPEKRSLALEITGKESDIYKKYDRLIAEAAVVVQSTSAKDKDAVSDIRTKAVLVSLKAALFYD